METGILQRHGPSGSASACPCSGPLSLSSDINADNDDHIRSQGVSKGLELRIADCGPDRLTPVSRAKPPVRATDFLLEEIVSRTKDCAISMSIATIVRGHGTGARLFLFWTLGTFVAYGINHALTLTVRGLNNTPNPSHDWVGLMLPLLALSLWEAVLLLPTWPRRLGWTFTFLFASIACRYIDSFETSDWYHALWYAALLQTFFLIRVRNRTWIWLLAVIAAYAL